MAAADSLNQARGDDSGGFEDWFGVGTDEADDESGGGGGGASASTSLMVGGDEEPLEQLMCLEPNECLQLWKDGLEVLKFGRKGLPHLRKFTLDEEHHSLKRRNWFREHFVPKFKEKHTSKCLPTLHN